MRRQAFLLTLLLSCLPLLAQKDATSAARIRTSLEKMQKLGKVLHIAAHPDDENTAFLALSALGWKYQTAYMSLTRGEGGQNLIGSEQGELMGVIRTQELMAARRMDGAEQFFSRAIDFGFTKTADETLTKWNRDKVLGDVVYVIRKFQPDIIVLRFSGTPRDGHGQHQASSILGREAFAAAADPKRFPEQLAFVQPWQARRLFLNIPTFSPAMEKEAEAIPEKITVDLGAYDPVLGYSFGEIAGFSRSQHRSQAMGWREDRGAQRNFFVRLAGEPTSRELMEGIDTTWNRVPGSGRVSELLGNALQNLDDRAPERLVPQLLELRRELKKLNSPWATAKLAELEELIGNCVGLFLDAGAAKYYAVAGQPVELRLSAINRSTVPLRLVRVQVGGVTVESGNALDTGRQVTEVKEVAMPAQPTQPYWLAKQRSDTMYAIDDVRVLAAPDGPPALTATFELTVNGEPLVLNRPVKHRYVDRIYGELTRPLVAVPPATVRISEKTVLFPSAAAREVAVQVTAMSNGVKGVVRLNAPGGWTITPASRDFALTDAAEQATVLFQVKPPAKPEVATLQASVEVNGQTYGLALTSIDYPHIPPQAVFARAEAKLVRADVKVLSKKIGYVMGSGDEVPRALEQMGCEVTLLSKDDLAQENLSRYDAIVTGVRAFNTRADLRANTRRLFAYAEAGGTVVVQYNVMEGGFFGGNPKLLENVGPYPITTSQERVTVEEAQVEFAATHPLMTGPNTISAKDFDGWVQERGLYFASKWDERYTSLFSMHDPGEKPMQGGTLYTRYGKGAYVFTPLSWFRQLPAGVPGAYRLFANFLSAGKVTP